MFGYGLLPIVEAGIQGAATIVLTAGFLSYLAEDASVARRFVRLAIPIHALAFGLLVVLFFLLPGPTLLGLPRHKLVAGLVGLGGVLVAIGWIAGVRTIRSRPERWILGTGIAFFLASIAITAFGFFGLESVVRPPVDMPWGVGASAIGVVLMGYLLVRRHATEMRTQASQLEDQVRQRTAHLERAHDALKIANAKLAEQATVDDLTGVRNRRYFDEALEKEWARAAREGVWFSVALVDLDELKEINDRFGHAKGDECLIAVGQHLRNHLRRPADVAARYGGDEFGVILPNTDEDGMLAVLQGVRRRLEEHGGNPAPGLSVSIGVASCVPGPELTAARLLRLADRGLYQAKQAGRNRVVVGRPDSGRVAKAG